MSEEKGDSLAVPHEANATLYTGSGSYRPQKQLPLPLHHLALARMCLLQEMCTDHVRPVGSLGGAPRGVHRRHEAGRSDTPRGARASQIPPRSRPRA